MGPHLPVQPALSQCPCARDRRADVLRHIIPLVEVAVQSPIANKAGAGAKTTGTVNPGFIYLADTYQLAVEAQIPVNRASGKHWGVIAQLHFFFDDIFPNSIGKPIFAER